MFSYYTCASASLMSFGNPFTDPESIDLNTWKECAQETVTMNF